MCGVVCGAGPARGKPSYIVAGCIILTPPQKVNELAVRYCPVWMRLLLVFCHAPQNQRTMAINRLATKVIIYIILIIYMLSGCILCAGGIVYGTGHHGRSSGVPDLWVGCSYSCSSHTHTARQ